MITVGCTAAPFKGDRELGNLTNWASNLDALTADAASLGHELYFLAALETDGRGMDPYAPLLDLLNGHPGAVWTFSMDDGQLQYRSNLRTLRVVTGRNMVVEYAMRNGASHVLHLDSDVLPDPQSVSKLLDVDWPVVGGEVPAYCLTGRPQGKRLHWRAPFEFVSDGEYGYPVQRHWNTAGYLLVRREVYERVRWGWSPVDGLSDDPWFARACEDAGFGFQLVRKDCVGVHEPLGTLEDRGEDLVIRR